MKEPNSFGSIDALRAFYYPEGSKLLDMSSKELLEFPKRLSRKALAKSEPASEKARAAKGLKPQRQSDPHRSGATRRATPRKKLG
jgi:predicted metal-binding transcription factor (methanogenesis marker protein 9)